MPPPGRHCCLLAVAGAVGLLGCADSTGATARGAGTAATDSGRPDSGAAFATGHSLTGVEWTLAVDSSGLSPLDDGGPGWRLERADGAALEVTEAWLVVYVVTLETCAEAAARARTPPPHGLPDHASATTASHAIPLHTDAPVDAGAYAFDADTFCQVGVALFRGDTVTENQPDDVDLNGTTLHLEGRMRPAAGAEWEPLALSSSLAGEADLPLPDTSPGDPAAVAVSFRPAALLDDLDLHDDPDRVAFSMIKTLAATAVVSLDPR